MNNPADTQAPPGAMGGQNFAQNPMGAEGAPGMANPGAVHAGPHMGPQGGPQLPPQQPQWTPQMGMPGNPQTAGMYQNWGMPGYAPYNPYYGYAMPGHTPPPYPPTGVPPEPMAAAAQQAVDSAAFSAAMGDIAEKSGLGMFKDFLNFNDGEFWKGALVGAAVVLLVTNDELRGSLFGGAAKAMDAMKSGVAGMAGANADEEEELDQSENNESGEEHRP